MIFTVELENMKTILSSKFEEYEYPTARITSWQPLLGPGIFAVDGPHWQHSRKVISKAFMRDQVGDVDLFEDHVIRLIDAIPKDGKTTVDLQPLFFDMIMDSATEFLFGESTDVLSKVKTPASKRNHDFAEAWDRSQLEVMNGMMLPMYRFPKQFYADKKVLHEFVDGYVKKGQQFQREWSRNPEKAEAKGSGRYVLMHELSKNLDDPKQIRAELLNVLLASRDTTATLLSNVWWILARYPDVWTKIRKEIDDIVAPGERPTYDEVKRMTYIKYVCLESKHHQHLSTILPVGRRLY